MAANMAASLNQAKMLQRLAVYNKRRIIFVFPLFLATGRCCSGWLAGYKKRIIFFSLFFSRLSKESSDDPYRHKNKGN
jgi:hypothetical protein